MGLHVQAAKKSNCEQAFPATRDLGGRYPSMGGDGVVALETGAAGNLARFRWPGNHYSLGGRQRLPRISTFPACERSKIGDGRHIEVRFDADSTVGFVGRRGTLTTFAPAEDAPALLRKGALGKTLPRYCAGRRSLWRADSAGTRAGNSPEGKSDEGCPHSRRLWRHGSRRFAFTTY